MSKSPVILQGKKTLYARLTGKLSRKSLNTNDLPRVHSGNVTAELRQNVLFWGRNE